jgi:hypothetical protein
MLYQLSYVRVRAIVAPGSQEPGRGASPVYNRKRATSVTASGVGDDDRRAELDVGEEPLGVRDVHADAAVRGRIAD